MSNRPRSARLVKNAVLRNELEQERTNANRLRSAVSMANGLSASLTDRLRRAEEVLTDIYRCIPKEHIAGARGEIGGMGAYEYDGEMRVHVPKPFRLEDLRPGAGEHDMHTLQNTVLHLVRLTAVQDHLAAMLHFRVRFSHHADVVYGITDEGLRHAPRDLIARNIAADLTDGVLERLEKHYPNLKRRR